MTDFGPLHGWLLGFDVLPDGSVMLSVSSGDDGCARDILLTRRELAGMAEASAETFRTWAGPRASAAT